MSRTIRRIALAASLLVAPALIAVVAPESDATAAESATTASGFLKVKQDLLIGMLSDPKVKSADERAKNVNAELLKLIDYTEMAKASLGEEWGKRSDAEQKQFKGLLQQLIEKSYKKRLDELGGYKVSYDSESTSNGDTTVKTTAKNQKDNRAAPLLIDYVLRKKGSDYVIVDIVPEGSSYVKTYNKEFTKVLKKPAPEGGWDALIAKMNKKLTEK
jgi:phospholipid transport system substrate-binding protein